MRKRPRIASKTIKLNKLCNTNSADTATLSDAKALFSTYSKKTEASYEWARERAQRRK